MNNTNSQTEYTAAELQILDAIREALTYQDPIQLMLHEQEIWDGYIASEHHRTLENFSHVQLTHDIFKEILFHILNTKYPLAVENHVSNPSNV